MGDHPQRRCRCHSFVSLSSHNVRPASANPFSGDFTLYDHLLDHSFNFGVVPQRYVEQKLSPLDTFFGEFWLKEGPSSG